MPPSETKVLYIHIKSLNFNIEVFFEKAMKVDSEMKYQVASDILNRFDFGSEFHILPIDDGSATSEIKATEVLIEIGFSCSGGKFRHH